MARDFDDPNTFQPTTVRTTSNLRTCTSIVTPQSATELVEPRGAITTEEAQELLRMVANRE
jgi:hypothetical protein